jgi:hypothetical protein
MKLKYFITILVLFSITACSCDKREPQQVYQQPAPVVVNNGGGINSGDVLLGAVAGYAIGQMMSNGQRYDGHNAPTKIINNKTYIITKDGKTIPSQYTKSPTMSATKPQVSVSQKQAFSRIYSSPTRSSGGSAFRSMGSSGFRSGRR